MKSATPKFSPPLAPKMAPRENFAKKKLTPGDYLYKNQPLTIKRNMKSVTPKFSPPPTSLTPKMAPRENFAKEKN